MDEWRSTKEKGSFVLSARAECVPVEKRPGD